MPQEKTILYILATTPRSGSNWIGELLEQHGLGRPRENFNPFVPGHDFARVAALGGSSEDYLRSILPHGSTPTIFGTKIHWEFLEMIKACCASPVHNASSLTTNLFAGFKFIHLRRHDKVRQAVSFIRAQDSGQWGRREGVPVEKWKALPSMKRVHQQILDIRNEESNWCQFFDNAGVRPHTLFYEDVLQNQNSAMIEIGQFLGRSPVPAKHAPISFLRQADYQNEQAFENYMRLYETSDSRSKSR